MAANFLSVSLTFIFFALNFNIENEFRTINLPNVCLHICERPWGLS